MKALKKAALLTVMLHAWAAHAECPDYERDITIEVIKDYGEVIFDDTLSRDQFSQVAGGHGFHRDTTGLTVASFGLSVEADGTQIDMRTHSCVYLDKVKLFMSYDNIHVLIDNMYRKDSCQYKVILEHEKKHVAVHKKSLDYYAPYISGAMERAVADMPPMELGPGENVDVALGRMTQQLVDKISGMLDFFEEERDKANAELDTHDNYEKERNKCPYW